MNMPQFTNFMLMVKNLKKKTKELTRLRHLQSAITAKKRATTQEHAKLRLLMTNVVFSFFFYFHYWSIIFMLLVSYNKLTWRVRRKRRNQR